MSTRRTRRNLRTTGLLLGLCLVATACGAQSESSAQTSAVDAAIAEATATPEAEPTATPQPEPEPEPEPTATSTPEPAATPEPTSTPAPADPDAAPIEQVYGENPVNGGWPVTAGRWSSSSFSQVVSFDLPIEARLLTDGLGHLEFEIGPADEPRGWLYVVEPIAINRPTGPIPIDLVAAEAAFDGSEVLGESTSVGPLGEISTFDFFTTLEPIVEQFVSGCFRQYGQRCIAPFVTESGQGAVMLGMDRVHQVAAADFGEEGRLYVIASPTDQDDTDFLGYATEVMTTLRVAGNEPWEGKSSLDRIGTDAGVVPPGEWVRAVGSTLLTLSVDTELAVDALLFPELDAVGFQAGTGSLFLVHYDHRYDLETGGLPANAEPWRPPTRAELEANIIAAGGTFVATDAVFAGLPATRYDLTFDEAEPCPQLAIAVPTGTRCSTWFRSTNSEFYSLTTGDDSQTTLYIEEVGLLILKFRPENDAEAEALLTELEANLELTPIG